MPKRRTYKTKTGRVLTDADIEALADEAQSDYEVDEIKQRRRGRPMLGSGPAEVVPVRLDPGLKRAVDSRAERDELSVSEVIREALRRYLESA